MAEFGRGNASSSSMPLLARYLMNDTCYQTFFKDFDLLNGACLALVFSKLLGYTIIMTTTFFMKLPQITKMLRSRSGQGVSFLSQVLMVVSSSLSVAYAVARDYPISLWGENISIAIQTLIIGILILMYERRLSAAVLFTVVYVLSMMLMLSPAIPLQVHVTLQLIALPLGSISKIVQIATNYRNGSTGQLSLTYILLTNFRSAGRLVTMALETNDYLRIFDFAFKSSLNVTLLAQMIYYNSKRGGKPSGTPSLHSKKER